MTPFQSISEACRSTGLSQHYLRQGCRDGTVPHIMCGCKYVINVPLLLRQLGATVEEEEASAETENRPAGVLPAGR